MVDTDHPQRGVAVRVTITKPLLRCSELRPIPIEDSPLWAGRLAGGVGAAGAVVPRR
jgi:hypothetical protein